MRPKYTNTFLIGKIMSGKSDKYLLAGNENFPTENIFAPMTKISKFSRGHESIKLQCVSGGVTLQTNFFFPPDKNKVD